LYVCIGLNVYAGLPLVLKFLKFLNNQGTVREMTEKLSNTEEEPAGPSAKGPKYK